MTYTQWSKDDNGTYFPVGETMPSIEPGHYNLGVGPSGSYFIPVTGRDDALLDFPDSASRNILNGVIRFWEREAVFTKYGVPFKRGILLYGPPGSGKTCTLEMVSRDVIERGGIVVSYPGHSQILLHGYRALREIQPEIPLVVIMEDFENYGNDTELLNVLDGVEKIHKVVFLATSNYPERLDPRILNRPSRFDVRIKVGHPVAASRRLYLENLLHPGDEMDVNRYVADTEGMSLAHVKELFVATVILSGNYEQTVVRLQQMHVEQPNSDDNDETPEWERDLLADSPAPARF